MTISTLSASRFIFPSPKNISLRTFLNYDLLNTGGVFVQSYNKFERPFLKSSSSSKITAR